MNPKKVAIALLCMSAWLLPASQASAATTPTPVWRLIGVHLPTHFAPGAKGRLFLIANNVGGAPTTGKVTLTDTLPLGLTPISIEKYSSSDPASAPISCEISGQTVTCTTDGPVGSGRQLEVIIKVEVDPLLSEGPLPDEAEISGGGALSVVADTTTRIDKAAASFDFLPPNEGGLEAPLTEADGSAATQAGSHPYQLTTNVGFPTEEPEEFLIGAGHPREISVELPRGMVVDPTATPVLCAEAELITITAPGCPAASAVGLITVITNEFLPKAATSPLYNMVPPPGTAAMLAFDATGAGIFVHIRGEVRSDGDYGISGVSEDTLALTGNPVFGARVELWGDPTDPIHDGIRGICAFEGGSCSAEALKTAQLTLPSECTGNPSVTRAKANSWQKPEVFHEATYESADLDGNPTEVEGCNQLAFEPTIEATPTTNLTDSPSGLKFNLHQPQNTDVEGLSTAALKDAVVTLPKGMVVNPSQGAGLKACSTDQIGLTTEVGETPIHFDKAADACPDASKIGTLKATTPLLAQFDEAGTKVQRDPEGHAIPRPVEGSVYLAEPFENPFGSLLAIYLSIEDPKSGTVAKLAGEVEADPSTGQLATWFEENPQLPIEDIDLELFGGARAPLITPLTCGTHTTTSSLTPWSAPEGADASPSSSFATTGAPGGGACPSSEAGAPNQPSFSAGTVSPQAATYSPFVLKLSREDGSQRLTKIDVNLPSGLTGKLAGIAICSEAQLAQAISRSHPNQGAIEQANPSCPASSEVGTVDVSAGAGPTPLNVQGHAYLTGPYKGAPLSMAIVTPAVAGPFDLGAVTVRTALYVDSKTARIHAVSDPLPTILEGIPLDLRSAYLRMGRPQFVLNPTSCDPMAIDGSATSVLGQNAALSSPFQVGGCSALPFKPKLSLRLKGGTKRGAHPKLLATLTAKPGEANIAATSVQLPRSAFLEQSHIGTVCTRVQFAADTCPKASIYGKATATTPLLDYTLSGNVYLRSSDNPLPDLLIDLRGPDYQPFRIELAGRTDAVKGALRNSFDLVPDAPVSKFSLELFGGKRGLVVNSRNLCARTYKAKVLMDAQNGKTYDTNPVVKASCKGKARKGGKGKERGR